MENASVEDCWAGVVYDGWALAGVCGYGFEGISPELEVCNIELGCVGGHCIVWEDGVLASLQEDHRRHMKVYKKCRMEGSIRIYAPLISNAIPSSYSPVS